MTPEELQSVMSVLGAASGGAVTAFIAYLAVDVIEIIAVSLTLIWIIKTITKSITTHAQGVKFSREYNQRHQVLRYFHDDHSSDWRDLNKHLWGDSEK